jgi:hypothetical protein
LKIAAHELEIEPLIEMTMTTTKLMTMKITMTTKLKKEKVDLKVSAIVKLVMESDHIEPVVVDDDADDDVINQMMKWMMQWMMFYMH